MGNEWGKAFMLRVKNWKEFQHYKDRSPPWIKLHKGLLDDYEYQCLPLASRALAPMIWLLASESSDGCIDGDHKKLAFRLRVSEKEIRDGLIPLIEKGFLIDDSKALADRNQDACLETETETETETTLSGKPDISPSSKAEALAVLDYLNQCAKRSYRPVDANLKFILGRLKSGATPLQMREVVFAKCQQWGDDEKMSEYLRPATLFNATKFEQYLGELSA